MSDDEATIEQMLNNMADPNVMQAKKVECPIDGCEYSGEPSSVSGHLSASTQDDHIWANTRFNGFKHFNSVMREQVEEQVAEAKAESSKNTSSVKPMNRADNVIERTRDEVLQVADLPCPLQSCSLNGTAKDIAEHMESTEDHEWAETQFDDTEAFFAFVEDFC